MEYFNILPLNLQMFAEGGAPADGGTAEGQGVPALPTQKAVNPLANVKYGKQEEAPTAKEQTVDKTGEFQKLIKGEYKEEYGKAVNDVVQKRLKGRGDAEAKLNSLSPVVDLLTARYGTDDVQAIVKALEADDSYLEDEALERGMPTEELREYKKMEAQLHRMEREQQMAKQQADAEAVYAGWMEQAQGLTEIYPGFDLNAEIQNPKFTELLRSHVDVQTAYEVCHKDELIPAAMQYASKQTEKKVASTIAANGRRPTENGLRASSGIAEVKSDVSQLSKSDISEIIRRVQMGEKISF